MRPGFSPLCSKLCSGNQSHPINPINSLIMHSSAPIPAPVLRWSTATRPRERRDGLAVLLRKEKWVW